MESKVIWSPAAETDLEYVIEYLNENWSKRIVTKFINKVEDTITLIAEDPTLFPLVNSKLNIRKCVLTNQNTIFYRSNKSTVEIVRVFDTRQDPKKLTL